MLWLTLRQLKSKDPKAREQAAKALGASKNPQAVEALATALKDAEWEVQVAAAESLEQIGDARAIVPLTAALKDENFRPRWAAIRALGKIGGADVVVPLVSALYDRDSDIRREAATALAALDWKPANTDQHILYAMALGRYSEAAAQGEAAVEPLMEVVGGSSLVKREMRYAAAQALARVGCVGVERLVRVLNYGNPEPRETAREALIRVGCAAVESLIEVLQDLDEYRDKKRWNAAKALGEIGDLRAVQPLVATLKDEDGSVRDEAKKALIKIGKPSTEPLAAALHDYDWKVRIAAAETLGQIGDSNCGSLTILGKGRA
jgi:HEAT repeat protein